MKRILTITIISISIAAIFLLSGTALATPRLDFAGHITFSDKDGDGFSENMNFDTYFDFAVPGDMSGHIEYWKSPDDPLFSDGPIEYIMTTDFILDPTSYTSGDRYDFATNYYADGFSVHDDDGTMLFEGDIGVSHLKTYGQTGFINSNFMMNLWNITPGNDYIAGSSPIIDAFISAGNGSWQMTTQFANVNLAEIIENGKTAEFSYSGTTAPAPVPEPATMILLGTGLAGLALYRRKRFDS